jgi:hypothetical protein
LIWDDGLALAARDHCNDMKQVDGGFIYLGTDGKTLKDRLSDYGRVEEGLYSDYNFLYNPYMSGHGNHVHGDDTHQDLDLVVQLLTVEESSKLEGNRNFENTF